MLSPSIRFRILLTAGALSLGMFLCYGAGAQQFKNIAGLDVREGFAKAMENYRRQDYRQAAELFSQLMISFPDDPRYSICKFMLARSRMESGDLEKAETEFESFIETFPRSKYIGQALLLLGDIRFLEHDPYGAGYYYLQSYDQLQRTDLKDKARQSLENVINAHIRVSKLDDLADRAVRYGFELAPQLLFLKARREYRDGLADRARKTISLLEKKYPDSPYTVMAGGLESAVGPGRQGAFRIGILAPMSGRMSSYGIEMLRGIKLALEDYASSSRSPMAELEIYDNFGTPGETIRGVEQLATSGVHVIIGPLQSDNAFCAAAADKQYNIPVILPAAAAKGISSVSEQVFQVTPNSEYMARMMAEYAVNTMGINQFAIISPNDDVGEDISAAFSREVIDLGGEIVKVAFYQRGITDFKRPLTEIKEVLTAGVDTLIEQGIADSIYYNPKKPDEPLPKYEWPVTLGGLFVPGYADEVAMIAPQVVFGRMATTLLGTEGWSDPEVLRTAKGYLDGSVFVTDFFPFESDPRWAEFTDKFREHYAVEPTRIAGLSYDATMLALEAASKSGGGNITRNLSGIENHKGVSGTITFKGGDGFNREVIYCGINEGEVERLK